MESIFFNVLYRYNNWGLEPSIMAVESNEENKIIKLKLVSQDSNYLIQDYDYIIIGDSKNKKSDEMVLIDKNTVEKIDPEYWFFIDESTIIIEKMPKDKWDLFREECKKNNCYNEFKSRTKL